ncbi:hypothetical protein EB796_004200 [Bugula neritina]|uniref:VWFD domain-containing protein n=1 Tax=Bugula neritina TaxID=10212 RepID=A0A7J7KHW3_BUGNE|nr:hypothetical protein EB796_004200 [Bugula neritina]
MKLGIEIQYSGGHIFEMKVRPSYQSNICGLCGNYNLDPADDFTTGPSVLGQMPPTPLLAMSISGATPGGQMTLTATWTVIQQAVCKLPIR